MQQKSIIQSIILSVTLALVVTYFATNTLNPINVYKPTISLIYKIVESILLFSLLLSLMRLMSFLTLNSVVSNPVQGSFRLRDATCPSCGSNVNVGNFLHGAPVQCPNCRMNGHVTMFHKNCGKSMGVCPVCGQAIAS